MKRGFVILGAIFGALALLTPVAAQQSMTWTAGAVGGGWYAISGGMAELLREKAGLNIKVIPGGGTQNPVLVQKGEAELGMGLPPLLGAAMRGEDPYKDQKMADLRALAGNMSLNTFHFYVAADSPYAKMTVEEIVKGKKPIRVATSKPGSSDVWVFEKVMEFYGLCAPGKTDDCYKSWEAAGAKFFRGSYSEQAGAFKDRNVDGTFTFLALPGASITEASVGRDLKLLAFPKPLIDFLSTFGMGAGTIPAGTYPKAANGNEPVATATMGTTIAVNSNGGAGTTLNLGAFSRAVAGATVNFAPTGPTSMGTGAARGPVPGLWAGNSYSRRARCCWPSVRLVEKEP
jgi:TRAP transporter TAXI family solute receptor